jgi:16S rRNA processing protein RimM
MSSEMLEIGTVMRAHGIRGMLRVFAASDAILSVRRVFIDGKELKVERVQAEKENFLVQLEGIRDRNQAEAMQKKKLFARKEELPPLADDEIYVADLVGCRVFDVAGTNLGEVIGTFPGGAHEILVVKGEREFMLPMVDAIVTEVDVAQRRIVCDPPEGLLDLERAANERSDETPE